MLADLGDIRFECEPAWVHDILDLTVSLFAWPTSWRRWRRMRSQRRSRLCPTCGYDLTGNKSGGCPECARKFRMPIRPPAPVSAISPHTSSELDSAIVRVLPHEMPPLPPTPEPGSLPSTGVPNALIVLAILSIIVSCYTTFHLTYESLRGNRGSSINDRIPKERLDAIWDESFGKAAIVGTGVALFFLLLGYVITRIRARERRAMSGRCTKCGHTVSNTDNGMCPHCGKLT